MSIKDLIQSADWKKEKHAPVIECPDVVQANAVFEAKVGLGKEIAQPNTTEHQISWITIYFHPEGEKFPLQVGRYEFSAHGEHASGPNKGPLYTHHRVTAALKIDKPGTLHALALCNIHGLWESSKAITLG